MPWDHPLLLSKSSTPFSSSEDDMTSSLKNEERKDGNSSTNKSKVAVASKNARERRKKELETLLEENSKLKEERERFLQHIEMLQEKVIEMREKEGDIDLQLENDLLKAQLSEHSLFISALMRMANGVPTSDAEKRQLYRQGADYAVAHINSLLSRSVRLAGEWKIAKIPHALGASMAVWFQHVTDPGSGLRRLNLRADHIIPNVSADVVSSLYWSLWTSQAALQEIFQGSYVDATEISNEVILHDELVLNPNEGQDREESLATVYTRDEKAHHVFIASKREQSIARGSLALAMIGDDVGGQMIQPWKRRKCKMCARSNTNVNRLQENDPVIASHSSSSSCPSLSISSLNNPTYIEGSVAWDLDDNRGCRIASVLSLVEGFTVGKFDAFALIAPDGSVSDNFATFIRSFLTMLRSHEYTTPAIEVSSSSKSDSKMSSNQSSEKDEEKTRKTTSKPSKKKRLK